MLRWRGQIAGYRTPWLCASSTPKPQADPNQPGVDKERRPGAVCVRMYVLQAFVAGFKSHFRGAAVCQYIIIILYCTVYCTIPAMVRCPRDAADDVASKRAYHVHVSLRSLAYFALDYPAFVRCCAVTQCPAMYRSSAQQDLRWVAPIIISANERLFITPYLVWHGRGPTCKYAVTWYVLLYTGSRQQDRQFTSQKRTAFLPLSSPVCLCIPRLYVPTYPQSWRAAFPTHPRHRSTSGGRTVHRMSRLLTALESFIFRWHPADHVHCAAICPNARRRRGARMCTGAFSCVGARRRGARTVFCERILGGANNGS